MKTIRVWDPLVRLLHWMLVICVLSNLLNESGESIHRWLGYTASGVVLVRFVWGFVGTQYARFSDWFPTPSRLLPYLRTLLRNEAPRHIGHNPAGAVMMLALMALVLSLGATGYLMTTDAFFGEEWLEDIHEGLSNILIVSVVLHVGAALFEGWKHQENLVASMVHGKKPVHPMIEPRNETTAR
jgi:cytochrome b